MQTGDSFQGRISSVGRTPLSSVGRAIPLSVAMLSVTLLQGCGGDSEPRNAAKGGTSSGGSTAQGGSRVDTSSSSGGSGTTSGGAKTSDGGSSAGGSTPRSSGGSPPQGGADSGGGESGATDGGAGESSGGSGGSPPDPNFGGSAGADGGAGGEAGAPVIEPLDTNPNLVRTLGGEPTSYMVNTNMGGSIFHDVCPHDQVIIGFGYDNYEDFLNGLTVRCGSIRVKSIDSALKIDVVPGVTLFQRGGGDPKDSGDVMCPAGHVMVGFKGIFNDWIRKITFSCAPVSVGDAEAGYKVTVGDPVELTTVGKDSNPNPGFPLQETPYIACPAGQIARGTKMNAGFWMEGLGFYCGAPKVSFGLGNACRNNSDCTGLAACDVASKTCKAVACNAPSNCSCGQLDGKVYSFCAETTDSTYANAGSSCADQSRRLAWAKDGFVNGWQRYAALEAAVGSPYWIGLDSLSAVGVWSWANSGGPANFTDWHQNEPSNPASNRCAFVDADGAWSASPCNQPRAYVCE
ncbi:MAG TPA: C-type lectin domain-containing protein [Polyangiaceae bacterium]|nr:C-type lectin domain-containing protein [Polyangiaceae bacterium]